VEHAELVAPRVPHDPEVKAALLLMVIAGRAARRASGAAFGDRDGALGVELEHLASPIDLQWMGVDAGAPSFQVCLGDHAGGPRHKPGWHVGRLAACQARRP
jgi:hypothetical protein